MSDARMSQAAHGNAGESPPKKGRRPRGPSTQNDRMPVSSAGYFVSFSTLASFSILAPFGSAGWRMGGAGGL